MALFRSEPIERIVEMLALATPDKKRTLVARSAVAQARQRPDGGPAVASLHNDDDGVGRPKRGDEPLAGTQSLRNRRHHASGARLAGQPRCLRRPPRGCIVTFRTHNDFASVSRMAVQDSLQESFTKASMRLWISFLLLALLLVSQAEAASESPGDPLDSAVGETRDQEGRIPARPDTFFSSASLETRWALISQHEGVLLVGLKAADGSHRGTWRGEVVISEDDFESARTGLLALDGVREYTREDVPAAMPVLSGRPFPAVVVQLEDVNALIRVENYNRVEFTEPFFGPTGVSAGGLAASGCGWNAWSDPMFAGQVNRTTEPIAGGGPGDLVPWTYSRLRISNAWALSPLPGSGVNVGVLDTGLSQQQQQFFNFFPFERGFSVNQDSQAGSLEDRCGHGTKISSLIAAPRDGRSIVGIAWGAALSSQKINNDVVLTNEWAWTDACRGLLDAVDRRGARIINMAFGGGTAYVVPVGAGVLLPVILPHSFVFEECVKNVYHTRVPEVLMVAAAGTHVGFETFPSTLDGYIISASAVFLEDQESTFSYFKKSQPAVSYGGSVDFVSILGSDSEESSGPGSVPTSGKVGDFGLDDIAHIGGSSSATAHISGIFALAWANNPQLSRADLRARMAFSSSTFGIPRDLNGQLHGVGHGIPDAYRAAGGVSSVNIAGKLCVEPGTPGRLNVTHDGLAPDPLVAFDISWTAPLDVGASVVDGEIAFTAPVGRPSETYGVTVTDLRDGQMKAGVATVNYASCQTRTLYGRRIVSEYATALLGKRVDSTENSGRFLPVGCSITSVKGQEMRWDESSQSFVPHLSALETAHRGNRGWTIQRRRGALPNELSAQVHVWHDGLSSVRVALVYEVEAPANLDCHVPGITREMLPGETCPFPDYYMWANRCLPTY